MNRRDRETAIAFGESLDRDAQAEFGASLGTALTSKLASSVKVSTAKVAAALPRVSTSSTSSGKLAGSVALKVATPPKPAATVKAPAVKAAVPPAPARPLVPAGMTAPTAAGKASAALLTSQDPAAVKAAAKAETAQGGKSSAPAYPNVSSANFLEPGAGPIQSKPVLAPKLTPAQQAVNAANAKAADAAKAKRLEEQRQTSQAAFDVHKAAEAKAERDTIAYNIATNPVYAANEKSLRSSNTDWGLIPAGAAVLAAGAAIIATGGAAAGAIAAPSLATVAGAAVAADRALAATEKAKLVDTKGLAGKASGIVDAGLKAKAIIDNTVKLAELGVPGAVEGAKVIAETAAKRALDAIPGVPMDITAKGALDYANYLGSAPPAVADKLKAAGAALPPAKPGAGYSNVAAMAAKPVAVQTSAAVAAKKAKLGASVDAPARPRWLVTGAGKVLDVDADPNAVNVAGWLVWTSGKVIKQ
jgi:hypothetical protein